MMPHAAKTQPSGGLPFEADAVDNFDRDSDFSVWRRAIDGMPYGIALIDAANHNTLWVNAALNTMLRDGTGNTHVAGLAPHEYLPGLTANAWDEAVETLPPNDPDANKSFAHRLQFVHLATRNIAYWEWSVVPIVDGCDDRFLLLTVQTVSDRVFNERVLASAGRAAERARRRAEALLRLSQLVNASLTTPELLLAITRQAASFFDSEHAAVLLLCQDGKTLEVGHAIGLEEDQGAWSSAVNLKNTLAGRAITTRKTQALSSAEGETLVLPTLIGGRRAAGMISSPIWQDGRDYGVIEVYFSEPRDVPDNAQAILEAFADQTAIALHKAHLYDQLAAQQRQLQSIVENAPVSIIYFDTRGYAVSVNEAAADKYNLSVHEMLERPYTEFLADVPAGLFQQALEGAPFHASHHVHNSPTQGQTVCDLTLRPVRDETGIVVGVLLLSFEVTELVKARQEADQARQAAENALAQVQSTQTQMVQMEKMRAIGELASGVAHDFNNALQAILGYTELAEESLHDPVELTEQLAIIRKAAEDASATVQRLQRFARQRSAAHGKPSDVNAIVKDVIGMTRPRWKDAAQKQGRAYTVSTDLNATELIVAEPSGLREVLINIIYNALNAMPDGGALKISTHSHPGDHVEIRVQDTGTGMTPEVAARIFDPFFTTRGVEGTGLGLAVSWTIIQRNGGTIDVETEPGKGTCFILRFPIGDTVLGSVPALPSASRENSGAPGLRALVVDDEPFVASVLSTILGRNGYRVVAVHSAQAALDCLEEEGDDPYRLVLTDHGMPGMTGLQLVAEVKRRREDLPILLLTGWGESLLQTHITETLPDAVLGKPINQTDLLAAISRVLRRDTEPANA